MTDQNPTQRVRRTVYHMASGWWAQAREDEGRGELHYSSVAAERFARAALEKEGGGELVVLDLARKVIRREIILPPAEDLTIR